MTTRHASFLLAILGLLMSFPSVVIGEDAAVPSERSQEISASLARLKGSLELSDKNRNPLSHEDSEVSSTEEQTMGSLALKMGKGLVLCVGVLLIGLSIAKRMRPDRFTQESRVRIRERVALTPKVSLLIVEIDGKEQLLTVGSDQVSVLPSHTKFSRMIEDSSSGALCS
ncbi:MAG: FliO/MopB family protein, partial [Bdellovibrionales bacterium]|nr:FliO/MopB family protein [Bdellovibrionales bacterium]